MIIIIEYNSASLNELDLSIFDKTKVVDMSHAKH